MLTRKLKLNDDHEATLLLGEQDAKLRRLEREFGVEMFVRHDPDGKELHLTVRGAQARVEKCLRRLKERLDAVRAGHTSGEELPVAASFPTGAAPTPDDAIFVTAYGKAVRARGETQQEYVDTIANGDPYSVANGHPNCHSSTHGHPGAATAPGGRGAGDDF